MAAMRRVSVTRRSLQAPVAAVLVVAVAAALMFAWQATDRREAAIEMRTSKGGGQVEEDLRQLEPLPATPQPVTRTPEPDNTKVVALQTAREEAKEINAQSYEDAVSRLGEMKMTAGLSLYESEAARHSGPQRNDRLYVGARIGGDYFSYELDPSQYHDIYALSAEIMSYEDRTGVTEQRRLEHDRAAQAAFAARRKGESER